MHKILHVHPLKRCNLQCLHCYSSSSPQAKEELEIKLLQQAIADASSQGYNILSVSGGEPMLYSHLEELLETAHSCGMKTSVVSNGILLTKKRLEKLRGLADIIAISLDGKPELHDRMRNQPGAFSQMQARLPELSQSGIRFGFVFTVSKYNFRDLEWAVNFAIEHQAKLIRIHLLEEAGRAKDSLQAAEIDGTIAAYVYLQVNKLQKQVGERLNINVDLVHQEALRLESDRFLPFKMQQDLIDVPLAELISPLVIEADGSLVPLQYGMPRKYALGNIKQQSIIELAEQWKQHQAAEYKQLFQQAFQHLLQPSDFPIKDYFQTIYEQAIKIEAEDKVTA